MKRGPVMGSPLVFVIDPVDVNTPVKGLTGPPRPVTWVRSVTSGATLIVVVIVAELPVLSERTTFGW